MAERSLEAPGSATPRLRLWLNALTLAVVLGLIPLLVLRDRPLAAAPGAGVFFVTAGAVVLLVSAYLCFEQAARTGRSAFLHLAVACELSSVLAIGWALETQGVLTPDTDDPTGGELAIVGRASAAVAFLVPIATSVLALRRNGRGQSVVSDRTIRLVAGMTAVGGLLWLLLLGLHAAWLGPPDPAWHLPVVWAVVLLVCGMTLAMLVPGYRDSSVLNRVLILVTVLTSGAVVLAVLGTPRFTVAWYGAHAYALATCAALLAMLLARLHAADLEWRRTVAELQELRLVADAANHELRFQAGTDGLTGVANRHHFLSRLRRMIDHSGPARSAEARQQSGLAVAVIDLDGFKQINDRCGHSAGDAVLQEVAFRISKHLGRADLVGRLGGDEFGVAFADTDAARAGARLRNIAAAIARPIMADGVRVTPRCSTGYCVCPEDGIRPGELYRNADRAMYHAKRAGSTAPLSYAASMTATTQRDSAVRDDVLRGIADGRISLAYQPILDLRHGGVWGFEALVRLSRPDGSLAVAGDFLPAVVAGGQLPAVGHAVLDRLAQELPLILSLTDATVTFNLSAQEAADDTLVRRLLAGDVAPFADRLVVEVTEAAVAMPGVVAVLARLRERGYTVAVDDFGTGMSNMALLEQARPGLIKVDGEFTQALGQSPAAAAVIRSAVELAQGLAGCTVAAEGVETPKQQALLPELGVPLGQGFVLGVPISPARRGDARPEGDRLAAH